MFMDDDKVEYGQKNFKKIKILKILVGKKNVRNPHIIRKAGKQVSSTLFGLRAKTGWANLTNFYSN